MSGRVAHGLLMAHTMRHLRPGQVAHRLRLQGQRAAIRRLPEGVLEALVPRLRGDVPAWPAGFLPLDAQMAEGHPSPEENAKGRFEFLSEGRDIGNPPDWKAPDASRLWRYHLHYFEWAWSFATHPDRYWARHAFAALWLSWRSSTSFGRGDQWSPYVASLRAWALCAVHRPLWAGSDVDPEIRRDLSRHAAFLRAHIELDVGGNHLLKNLKALCGLGVFLGDDRLVTRAVRHVSRQLAVQVLADGGHFERSPSYHCQVLGDLMDVAGLLAGAGHPEIPGMADAISRMQRWLGSMLMPDGDVPLFNDCTFVGTDRLAALRPTRPAGVERLTVLPSSGYVVMRPGQQLHVVADVGVPCPSELPAHAHADCLSFELAVGTRRLIADTGTSTYEPGPLRSYERSTMAHNTVGVDGADQTEVWGTFRAARRATPTLEQAVDDHGVIEVTASHDGYERLRGSPRHRRTWRATGDGVELLDTVTGAGRHDVRAYLHLPGAEEPAVAGDGAITVGELSVVRSGPPGTTFEARRAELATCFGERRAGWVLVTSYDGPLPVVFRTVLALADLSPGNANALDGDAPKGHP